MASKLGDSVNGARIAGSRLIAASKKSDPEGRMPLIDHLRELRNRLLKAGSARRLTARKPGESKPLPWPSTLRTSWYSHGERCSSRSRAVVTIFRQSTPRRSRRTNRPPA